MLGERDPFVNISHWQMPSWPDHLAFIDRRPYREWWLIELEGAIVGACYLSKQNEIGIFVYRLKRRQGIGSAAVRMLMDRHPGERLLANINPHNEGSRAMFEALGFRHVQDTLALEAA